MSEMIIPSQKWREFFVKFSKQHARALVEIETHDRQTEENVASPVSSLHAIELDLEDERNPRINVTVLDGNKQIKRVLFRPSEVTLQSLGVDCGIALRIRSVHTDTTIRLRGAKPFDRLDLIRTLNVLDVLRDEAA